MKSEYYNPYKNLCNKVKRQKKYWTHKLKIISYLAENLCLQWELQDASCIKKWIAHSIQVVFWIILLNRLSLNLEDSGGVFLWILNFSSFHKSSIGLNLVTDWAIPTTLFSFSGTNWESLCSMFWIIVLVEASSYEFPSTWLHSTSLQ